VVSIKDTVKPHNVSLKAELSAKYWQILKFEWKALNRYIHCYAAGWSHLSQGMLLSRVLCFSNTYWVLLSYPLCLGYGEFIFPPENIPALYHPHFPLWTSIICLFNPNLASYPPADGNRCQCISNCLISPASWNPRMCAMLLLVVCLLVFGNTSSTGWHSTHHPFLIDTHVHIPSGCLARIWSKTMPFCILTVLQLRSR